MKSLFFSMLYIQRSGQQIKKYLAYAILLFSLVLLTACTSDRVYLEQDPELGWYPTRVENELAGDDPLEGFNRTMFTINDFCMEWIADPVARGYGSIMPRPAINALERVCLNLEWPARFITTLGSGEWKGCWDETCRFFINTTLGVAGIFDVAEWWFDIHSTESDFGQMFAIWGIGPGCTFILPFCKGTNVRDTVGFIFDCAFDIKTYLPYTYLATLNRFVVNQQAYAPVVKGSSDRYKTFRSMYTVYRENQIARWKYAKLNQLDDEKEAMFDEEGNPLPAPPLPVTFANPIPKPDGLKGTWITAPEYDRQTPAIETLRAVLTTPIRSNDYWWLPHTLWGTNFYRTIDIRKIDRGEDREKARYAYFPQPEPEEGEVRKELPLVIIVPGIDGTYDGSSTLAVAETFHNAGHEVISVDSVFFWRGMEQGAGNDALPGYVPADAQRLRNYFTTILADLNYNGPTILVGWSYGAVCAAHIMAAEEQKNTLNIRRAVLINPPADLGHAMQKLDAGLKKSASLSADDLKAKIPGTVGELLLLNSAHIPAVPMVEENPAARMTQMAFLVPRFEEQTAEYIASIMLRSGIRDILFRRHVKSPLPGIRNNADWSNRNSLYDELDRFDFERYAKTFLLPELAQQGVRKDFTALVQEAGLYPLKDFLGRTDKIYLIHNWNDILLSDPDKRFLDQTFGKRATWFDAGGHMGNLYLERFRNVLRESADAGKEVR